MTTWQELAVTTLYRADEWRAVYERLEAMDRLEFWEPGVVTMAQRGYSPMACLRWITIWEAARQPEPSTEEDLDRLASYSREFLDRMHKHDRWIPWVLFAIGLLVVCVAVAQLLLAVADAR